MAKYQELSLITSEVTDLLRSTNFNRKDVIDFYENPKKSETHTNLSLTVFTTAMKQVVILCKKLPKKQQAKPNGKLTSAKRRDAL
nr:unnamed protein product [Callosobruchus analis]